MEAPMTGTFWKHLARQIAMSGQALAQSGMAGFSCGQHGMSSAIAAVEARAMAEAGIGAASGATTSPMIARIGNRRRRISQSFTPSSIS